jgi:hypothetical protein
MKPRSEEFFPEPEEEEEETPTKAKKEVCSQPSHHILIHPHYMQHHANKSLFLFV